MEFFSTAGLFKASYHPACNYTLVVGDAYLQPPSHFFILNASRGRKEPYPWMQNVFSYKNGEPSVAPTMGYK